MTLWAVLASPAAAAQVALTPSCRAPGDGVRLTGTGFKAFLPYAASMNDLPLGSGSADETGAVDATFPAPSAVGTYVVRVADRLGHKGRATLTVQRPSLRMRPTPSTPADRVRYVVDGMGSGQPSIWLHRVDPDGRAVSNVRLGTGGGPCGGLTSEPRRVVPAGAAAGRWRLQVDTRMSYDPRATPRVVQHIRVTRD